MNIQNTYHVSNEIKKKMVSYDIRKQQMEITETTELAI